MTIEEFRLMLAYEKGKTPRKYSILNRLQSERNFHQINVKSVATAYVGYLSILSQNVKPGLAQRGGFPGGDGT